MGRAEIEAQLKARWSNSGSIKTVAVVLSVSVGLIFIGLEAWDVVEKLYFDAVSSPDGNAGYGNSAATSPSPRSSRASPGYSTGPDDKNYLRLPGVPDYPGRSR